MDDRILLYNYGGDYQENNTTTIDPDAVMWTQVLVCSLFNVRSEQKKIYPAT